jgi:mRNA interferase RelE/StbE
MNVAFKKSFLSEIKKIENKNLKLLIANCIIQIETANNISEIKNIKKLAGYDSYYRIRIRDYRIGIKIEEKTVYFVVFEHRKDIYKKFP